MVYDPLEHLPSYTTSNFMQSAPYMEDWVKTGMGSMELYNSGTGVSFYNEAGVKVASNTSMTSLPSEFTYGNTKWSKGTCMLYSGSTCKKAYATMYNKKYAVRPGNYIGNNVYFPNLAGEIKPEYVFPLELVDVATLSESDLNDYRTYMINKANRDNAVVMYYNGYTATEAMLLLIKNMSITTKNYTAVSSDMYEYPNTLDVILKKNVSDPSITIIIKPDADMLEKNKTSANKNFAFSYSIGIPWYTSVYNTMWSKT